MTTRKLRASVKALDPENDEHWTTAGLPAVHAVAELQGDHDFTRADLDEINWTRADAQAATEAVVADIAEKKAAVELVAVEEPEAMPAPEPPAALDPWAALDAAIALTHDERFMHNQGLRQMRELWRQVSKSSREWQGRWDEKVAAQSA